MFRKKDNLKNLQNLTGKYLSCFKPYLKEAPTQVFASEIYEIFNNTYLEEYLRRTASDKTYA